MLDPRDSIVVAGHLLQLTVNAVSGKASKSEENGLGDNEFLPWQLGAVM
ncbi:altronate hydrolase [Lampropedia aestuarii]|uniref:Altronate hydrolase n=1 Tax=Lampropedia aestuarii TaxID=2562762 RepID=A0A4S5BJ57_9BURK|nr:altronate hydrolase [Lampropedia aestuarii]